MRILFIGAILALLLYSANAYSQEVKLTLGVGTAIGQTEMVNSSGQLWDTGDVIGTAIVTLPVGYVDFSLWHHSIILDTQDYGITGISITKTWSFNL